MDRYEYKTEMHEGYRGMAITSNIQAELNRLGEDGWFLVHAHVKNGDEVWVELTLCRKIEPQRSDE